MQRHPDETIIAVPRSSKKREQEYLLSQKDAPAPVRGEGFLVVLVVIVTILFFPLTIFLVISTVRQSHVGAVLRFGRWTGKVYQPGLVWKLPFIDELVTTDMRMHTYTMPGQDMLTQDSVTVAVDAIIYYKITNMEKACFSIDNVHTSVQRLAQAGLRDVIGATQLQDVVSKRDVVNDGMRKHLSAVTQEWGVDVTHVEIRDITLPKGMQRAMSAKAEAFREADAKVVAAQGEKNAAVMLREAADEMMKSPGALQLRYLQTLTTIAAEQNSTIIFPMPIDTQSAISARDLVPLARK